MALPTYEELMLPLLRHTADRRQYSYADVIPLLRRDFRLSDSDLSVSNEGGQPRLVNRTPWAKKYLQEAGLLTGLRQFVITQRGTDSLASTPGAIDKSSLQRFPEFRLFLQRGKEKRR